MGPTKPGAAQFDKRVSKAAAKEVQGEEGGMQSSVLGRWWFATIYI